MLMDRISDPCVLWSKQIGEIATRNISWAGIPCASMRRTISRETDEMFYRVTQLLDFPS
jgi:hypothetical protein